MSKTLIRKVAVLGAGIMGAQIAAHFANAKVDVLLFDLPTNGNDKNSIVNKAIKGLIKLNPSPLASKQVLVGINSANYETDLEKLKNCDLVIEVIAEKLQWKLDLYHKIIPYLKNGVIFSTNTSGLSIESLAKPLPSHIRSNFCGTHFFNPPRYLPLVELIPHTSTSLKVLDDLETFLTTVLGKSIIRAKDTPNFLANRLGAFSLNIVMYYAEEYNISFEIVDALTGKLLGRPKSATFRTADLVGLDTIKRVNNNMLVNAKDDPWISFYELPKWMNSLIEKGLLGQKTKAGIYKKVGKDIFVLDIKTGDYRLADGKPAKEVVEILKEKNVAKRFDALRNNEHPEAKFLAAVFRDCFQYSAYHLASIADNVRDADLALRWGFGWKEGIFETWQKAGWQEICSWLKAENVADKTKVKKNLPKWVDAINEVYNKEGKAYSALNNEYQARRFLPVYEKQYYPDPVLNEKFDEGNTIFENTGVRLWTTGDNILICSFKTKMGTIGSDVLAGLQQAIKIAENDGYDGIVIWQRKGNNFSAGANLEEFGMAFMLDGPDAVKEIIKDFQKTMLSIRYSMIPVVAAVQGFAFGGGCELVLHADKTVAALETYMGLVEVGVGLVPAGGGCKEMTLRSQNSIDPNKTLQKYYKQIAMGEVAKSALEAKEMGYLKEDDIVVFHPKELLYVAKNQLKALVVANYRPPFKPNMHALGRDAKATIQMLLANMEAGKFISKYDVKIATKLASIMTGGDLDLGNKVDEEWYLHLERDVFIELAQEEKTQERIQHMLSTGKPLRN